MSNEYRNNHYVPAWNQDRFLPANQADRELYYLDLNPSTFLDPRGVAHPQRAVKRQGFRKCFSQIDLYTARFGNQMSIEIEKQFFGDIDRKGHKAVDYFENFAHP